MVDIQTVSIAVASAGVFAAAVYYIFQIRHQTKLRESDIVMRWYHTYCSKEFTEASTRFLAADYADYNDFVEKYGQIPTENNVQIAWQMVTTFFEGVGEMLHKRLVDIDLLTDIFAVSLYWKKAEPLIKDLRKQFDTPSMYEWFEYLYNEMKKREQKLQPTA